MAYWSKENYQQIISFLEEEQEEEYRLFQEKLIKTKDKIFGVRANKLRKKAKEIAKVDMISFLEYEDKSSFEEVLLEGIVLGMVKDPKTFWKYLQSYIKKVDNWATCDMACSSFQLLKKEENKEFLKPKIIKLLSKKDEFTVRVGVVLLMDYYLDEVGEILPLMDTIKQGAYYVQMAVAWLISVALVKNYNVTFHYLGQDNLDKFTHNKAIQKAKESFRLTKEEKEKLNVLKR